MPFIRRLISTFALITVLSAGALVSATGTTAAADARPITDRPMTKLSWSPPSGYDDPRRFEPRYIKAGVSKVHLKLQAGHDYRVFCPRTPIQGGLVITGGRNVVMIGCAINFPKWVPGDDEVRGLYLQDWTGTAHIEGVAITGPNIHGDAIDVATTATNATLQLQNIYTDTVYGTRSGFHADVVQNWGGPTRYRIDGLTGSSTYQGLFFQSARNGNQSRSKQVVLRHINLRTTQPDANTAGYLLYIASSFGTETRAGSSSAKEVYVSSPKTWGAYAHEPCGGCYPAGDTMWDGVKTGVPLGGDFVAKGLVGTAYHSPGYKN